MEFIGFSFFQGTLAFLAPCAVALLPGYIINFISRNESGDLKLSTQLLKGLQLALFSILGIFLSYSLAGGVIIVASQVLKDYMKWVTITMGGFLIVIGIMMLMGKSISLSWNVQDYNHQTQTAEAFVFGVAYAIGALGCLFPLFLIVATQAMAAPSVILGASYIFAYFGGISIMMIITILLAIFAKKFLMKNLRRILPHMERITGVLLIIGGVYVIYYQTALF